MIFSDTHNYSVKDLLLDESFQAVFIAYPKILIQDDLTKWMEVHPKKANIIEEARSLLLQLRLNLEEDEVQEEMNEVWERISAQVEQTINVKI